MSDMFCKRVQRREEDMSIYVCVKKKCMQLWQTSVLRATNPTHRGGGTAPKRAECQGGKKTGGSPVSCKQPPADRPTPPPRVGGRPAARSPALQQRPEDEPTVFPRAVATRRSCLVLAAGEGPGLAPGPRCRNARTRGSKAWAGEKRLQGGPGCAAQFRLETWQETPPPGTDGKPWRVGVGPPLLPRH